MNQLLDDILFLARAGSFFSAARRFGDLRLTLEQEMSELERGPFADLEAQSHGHPTRKLRATHLALHLTLDTLCAALSENAVDRVEATIAVLRTLVGAHRAAEQRQLSRLS